jgi:hypothetical protein
MRSKSWIIFCEHAQNYSWILLSSIKDFNWNNMIFIINFLLSNPNLCSRTYSVVLLWHYQDKVNNLNLVHYFLTFNNLIENTLSLECTQTLQYNLHFWFMQYVHITHKDTLQRIIHVNSELSCITQNSMKLYNNTYIIMATNLLKWVFAILMNCSF